MDAIDRELLRHIQNDGRITLIQLSRALHLSRPSVTERMRRLEENGVIEGYTARVSPAGVGKNTLVIIQISDLNVKCSSFEKVIKEEEEVIECHRVTGSHSYFMKAAVASMDQLEQLVDRLIPYGRVNTSVVLSSPVSQRNLLPDIDE